MRGALFPAIQHWAGAASVGNYDCAPIVHESLPFAVEASEVRDAERRNHGGRRESREQPERRDLTAG
jgi:hypothetical protein